MIATDYLNIIKQAEYYAHLCLPSAEEQHQLTTLGEILVGWGVDTTLHAAALLMPVIQHNLISTDKLHTQFSNRVLQIARQAAYITDQTHGENLKPGSPSAHIHRMQHRRFLFENAYTHLEATLVSIAARIACVEKLGALGDAQRLQWAEQTLQVYLPVMKLLGLRSHYDDIGALCLDLIDPELCERFGNYAFLYFKRHEWLFAQIRNTLFERFDRQHLKSFDVVLHDLPTMSLYDRMEQAEMQGKAFDLNMPDMLRVELLMRRAEDCYTALGIIHNLGTPLHGPEHFQDTIAAPLYNGFRALLTTVSYSDPRFTQKWPVQFSIRTHAMDRINRHGILAAMKTEETIPEAWWARPQLSHIIRKTQKDKKEQSTLIHAFTPTGEVLYPIRRGTTMVDVAFKIHSQRGAYASRFYANGYQTGPDYVVEDGDLIQIHFDKHYPTLQPEWEHIAYSANTRKKIRRFLKSQQPPVSIGRQQINTILFREMNIYEMRLPEERIDKILNNFTSRFDCSTPEEIYRKVAVGGIAPDEVVVCIIESEFVGHIRQADGTPIKDNIHIAQCWMQEPGERKWHKSTRVHPGTEIVGRYIGRGKHRRLTVYRKDSVNAPPPEQAVPLTWGTSQDGREVLEIDIITPPQSHIISMVMKAISSISKEDDAQRLTIHAFHSELHETTMTVSLLVEAPSMAQITALEEELNIIQRNRYILEMRAWRVFPGQKVRLTSKHDRRPYNPFTASKISDRSMFFGRADEITRVIEHLNSGDNFIVLSGQKRIGKSSLLHQLSEYLLPETCAVVPVPFDAHRLSPFNIRPFLRGLADEAHNRLIPYLKQPTNRRGLRLKDEDLRHDPFGVFAAWVRRIEARLNNRRLLFVIDEFTTAEEKYEQGTLRDDFFDGLQWLAGDQGVGFLLCVHDHVFRHSSRSWELLQRAQPIGLRALDRVSAARLIQQPLEGMYEFEHGLVEQLLDLTDCQPYFIHMICNEMLKTGIPGESYRLTTDEHLQKAIMTMLLTGDHYFNHFINRTDDHSWETVKLIAFKSETHDHWLTRDEIRDALAEYGYDTAGKLLSKSIGDLYHAGIIEARNNHRQPEYRIPVGLFRIWLRQVVTHPVISRDIQRKD